MTAFRIREHLTLYHVISVAVVYMYNCEEMARPQLVRIVIFLAFFFAVSALPSQNDTSKTSCRVDCIAPPGRPGHPGHPGMPGHNGAPGRAGPPGAPGLAGLPGATGPKGSDGLGIRGPKGLPGIHGKAGPKGDRGQKGSVGIQGPVGQKGHKGSNGYKGDRGLRGLPGPKGSPDATLTREIEQLRKELSELKIRAFPCLCSCLLKQNSSLVSGVYSVWSLQNQEIQFYCDMDTDGGGWTVFQRRQDGSVDFYRGWNDYKNGFGNIDEEFWLGLDNIHWLLSLSKSGNELRVDLGDSQGNRRYAKYSTFSVGDSSTKYVLGMSGYSGTAGDSLEYHNGMQFSTKDQDNDINDGNCAVDHHGAWWYKICHYSNLNGGYHKANSDGIWWNDWKRESFKFSEMKFRSM